MAHEPPQVLILSSIDWDAAWQRHQIFAAHFAAAGHEVFFVENSGFRAPGFADLGRVAGRLRNIFRRGPAKATINPRPKGLHVITPTVLPPVGVMRYVNREFFIPSLIVELQKEGLREKPEVICYFPTDTTLAILRRLAPRRIVFDCASNFRAHPHAPKDFGAQERELLQRSNLVVCDSDFLYQQKSTEHRNVVQIHQGVADDFFVAPQARRDFRRLGYYGTWSKDLDPAFLAPLASAGYDVALSGFVKEPAPALPAGVRHLGAVAREDLVPRLSGFDVFLMPYRRTPFLMGVVPAKIYECLALGRPVVATPLPSLEPFAELIYIASTPEEWLRVVRRLPETETEALREKRRRLALEHAHGRQFERLRAAMEDGR